MSDDAAARGAIVLPASGHRRYAWRNGRGSAMEIAAEPPRPADDGATSTPGWTVSIATIETDVAFSSFPGVDRCLMALSDGGLQLVIDGVEHEMARWDTVTFDGESDVESIRVERTTLDLNLMVARDRYDGSLGARAVDGTTIVLPRPGSEMFVVLVDGALQVDRSSIDGHAIDGDPLHLHDAVRLGADPLSLTGTATIAVARITTRS